MPSFSAFLDPNRPYRFYTVQGPSEGLADTLTDAAGGYTTHILSGTQGTYTVLFAGDDDEDQQFRAALEARGYTVQ